MAPTQSRPSELERSCPPRDVVLDCYLSALKNLAFYAVDVDPLITEPHRKHLAALCDGVAAATPEALQESRATLRGLLRDYRDKASQFLNKLREELATTAQSLADVLESVAHGDGDHEARLRTTLAHLRAMTEAPPSAMREALLSAAACIEEDIDSICKGHQLTVSQFQAEIRMLHKRIDVLETAVAVDNLTKLFSRAELEERVRASPPGFSLLLAEVTGFQSTEIRFGSETAEELAAAFAKRLRNGLPPTAVVARWGREEFVAMLAIPAAEVHHLAKWVSQHLAGPYACLQNGKSVRPTLQIRVSVLECGEAAPEAVLDGVKQFFDKS